MEDRWAYRWKSTLFVTGVKIHVVCDRVSYHVNSNISRTLDYRVGGNQGLCDSTTFIKIMLGGKLASSGHKVPF